MVLTRKISTFAVIDLETTGIPEYNFNKANITEISIHGIAADFTCSERVVHRINLLFNPRMMIDPGAEKITKLSNEALENEAPFNVNAANLIINFLKHLRQPVCLVAHNGNKFDFPILKHAFEKIEMHLPNDVICIDSLSAIKELDKLALDEKNARLLQEDQLLPLPDLENLPIAASKDTEKCEETLTDFQKLNEITPKRPTIYKKRSKSVRNEESNSRMKLNPRSLFDTKSSQNVKDSPKPKISYKLEEISSRLFGKTPKVAHQAEADVIILSNVLRKYGEPFVRYAEANAIPFSEIKRLGAS